MAYNTDGNFTSTTASSTLGELKIKVGAYISTLDTPEVFTFAEAFPNGCSGVILQRTEEGESQFSVTAWDKDGFTVNRPNAVAGSQNFSIFAIGY